MQTDRLTQIADRQTRSMTRDIAFSAFMAVVVGIMLLAFTTTGKVASAQTEVVPEAANLADTAAQIQAHTQRACGDYEPAPAPIC